MMSRKSLRTTVLVLAFGLVAAACGTSDDATGDSTSTSAAAPSTTTTQPSTTTTVEMVPELGLDVTGFPELADGAHYEN